ncbi:hypothetical protein FACS1894125_7160 [Actinomycetota bacterium]|nr:hypothetical protein FACS1894125_7160 [Actinomycetota bacterium]
MQDIDKMPTHLKDGTLWDDAKSDEWVDGFLEKIDKAIDEGKVIQGGPSKKYLEKKLSESTFPRPRFTISIKSLPRKLQEELVQNA